MIHKFDYFITETPSIPSDNLLFLWKYHIIYIIQYTGIHSRYMQHGNMKGYNNIFILTTFWTGQLISFIRSTNIY